MQLRVLKKFLKEDGSCPYDQWFDRLRDKKTQAIVSVRLNRLILGSFGNCRPLGGRLSELKINYGPGFRIYFTEDEGTIVILLSAGDKSSQNADIVQARLYLDTYRKRK